MRELMDDIATWRAAGLEVALARVVGTEGSAPRPAGAAMAVSSDGRVAGSVSGGCVEGAVVTAATSALRTRRPVLERFGYSDEDAFAVGLSCGGAVSVLVSPGLPGCYDELEEALRAGETAVLVTVVSAREEPGAEGAAEVAPARCFDAPDGVAGVAPGASALLLGDGRFVGSLGAPGLDGVARRDAAGMLSSGSSGLASYTALGRLPSAVVEVFFHTFAEPPRMVVLGAVDFAAALCRQAKLLGYRVSVCDARAVFATRERFPTADEVVADRPERYLAGLAPPLGPRDAVCVLTHEARFDVPAILAALATPVGYLGALGSRRTTADRRRRLLEAGASEVELERLHAPVGLDIGARTPEETALAICAEVVAVQNDRPAGRLAVGKGPIHGRLAAEGARN